MDSHSRVTQFFPLPVITRQLRLSPQSFHQDGSLRVAFHGQPLSNFNRRKIMLKIVIMTICFRRFPLLIGFFLSCLTKSIVVILLKDSIRYLGCILDIDGEFVVKSLIDSGGTCRSTCMASYHQFYSYYENQSNVKLLIV